MMPGLDAMLKGAAACLLATTLAVGAVQADEPQAVSEASNGEFEGSLIVTGDLDWFDRLADRDGREISPKPQFMPGQSGALAISFANPDSIVSAVRVECDLTSRAADGSARTYPTMICYDGPVLPEGAVYPADLRVEFTVGDENVGALAGYDLSLHDTISGKSIELSVSYAGVAP